MLWDYLEEETHGTKQSDQTVQWNEEEEKWFFSVVDVVAILAKNDRPRKYWNDLKRKLNEEGSELSEKIGQLRLRAVDGKMRQTDVADTEQLLRIIQEHTLPQCGVIQDAAGIAMT